MQRTATVLNRLYCALIRSCYILLVNSMFRQISVVLRARVIPECLDNPNINSLREVTSCQNSLSD